MWLIRTPSRLPLHPLRLIMAINYPDFGVFPNLALFCHRFWQISDISSDYGKNLYPEYK